MTKEDIEKAAVDNCVFENSIFNPELTPYYEQGFIDGAEWRISSIWHDASEKPEKKFALVEYKQFPKGHGYLVVPDANEVIDSISRYAYIEDLILNTEE
ncbi:hypothetical protein O6P32_10225 [Phocaeicola sp. KGMB11183]|uniref:Uncharacterized protein n=1 Tax=Phocaeicola acetigenes TaxID=3016083 RepID=A0ABT4PJ58_9BACT|nr:hypothetical protein [Phocaeicola sp. KGMB11183]MCZ8373078.1 hypothetical protein [Phocaeicola sp. KGMB11183]